LKQAYIDNNWLLTANDSTAYNIDIEKIASGEDTRTTVMVKNIPNKYD
jgi:hypothetical protein